MLRLPTRIARLSSGASNNLIFSPLQQSNLKHSKNEGYPQHIENALSQGMGDSINDNGMGNLNESSDSDSASDNKNLILSSLSALNKSMALLKLFSPKNSTRSSLPMFSETSSKMESINVPKNLFSFGNSSDSTSLNEPLNMAKNNQNKLQKVTLASSLRSKYTLEIDNGYSLQPTRYHNLRRPVTKTTVKFSDLKIQKNNNSDNDNNKSEG